MATASGSIRFGLCATLLSALVSGCVAQMPVKLTAGAAGSDADNDRERPAETTETGRSRPVKPMETTVAAAGNLPQQLSLSAGDAPIPQQAYDTRGVKVPYVPQSNPYTGGNATVPTEARAMFVAASARLSEGNLSAAQAKFEQLTGQYPDLSGPWLKLGEIAERREQYDVAIGHYQRAISLNRNNVNAYIALGVAQRRQGRFNDAQNSYLAALDVWKDFPEAHLNLAILYDLYGNQPAAAQRHYEAYAFLTGGKNETAHKWLVEVRQRTGIEQSFIDSPPVVVEIVPADKADSNSVAAVPVAP
jgi:tetratricopeptide (TPR) repeat protein